MGNVNHELPSRKSVTNNLSIDLTLILRTFQGTSLPTLVLLLLNQIIHHSQEANDGSRESQFDRK